MDSICQDSQSFHISTRVVARATDQVYKPRGPSQNNQQQQQQQQKQPQRNIPSCQDLLHHFPRSKKNPKKIGSTTYKPCPIGGQVKGMWLADGRRWFPGNCRVGIPGDPTESRGRIRRTEGNKTKRTKKEKRKKGNIASFLDGQFHHGSKHGLTSHAVAQDAHRVQ
jgi:hypothetical protein